MLSTTNSPMFMPPAGSAEKGSKPTKVILHAVKTQNMSYVTRNKFASWVVAHAEHLGHRIREWSGRAGRQLRHHKTRTGMLATSSARVRPTAAPPAPPAVGSLHSDPASRAPDANVGK